MAERPWKFESSRPHHLPVVRAAPDFGSRGKLSRQIAAQSAGGARRILFFELDLIPTSSMLAPKWGRPPHKRKLGLAMCVALVVGNMVGAGVFLLPADLAPLGWNSVYGWSATLAGTLCLTVVLSRLARDLGGGCGPFTYPAAAFGRGTGFVVAWSYWISIWVTNATLAVAVIRNLGVPVAGVAAPGIAATIAIGVIWLFVVINCLGVRAAGGTQVVTTGLKLIPLFGAIGVGLGTRERDGGDCPL